MTNEQGSFKASFRVLQEAAQRLRAQEEPDIDNLLPTVVASVKAYQDCNARVNAVEQALKEAFARVDEGAAAGGKDASRPAEDAKPAAAVKNETGSPGDDIPF
jgi:exodeoxyribonuclease VII small subunit